MNNKTRNIVIAAFIILIAIIGVLIFFLLRKDKEEQPKENAVTDAVKFAEEYTQIREDNVFVYKTVDEIIEILESGTGIVYFGFPECKWCQRYVVYLNDVAKEYSIEEIYYYNIREIRQDNTEKYQKIVSLLGNELDKDDDGNPRVYVPDVTFVKDGEIVGHDNETSLISSGEPDDYWTTKKITALKERIKNYIVDAELNQCTSCDE